MSQFWVGNLLLACSIVSSAAGQVLLKRGMTVFAHAPLSLRTFAAQGAGERLHWLSAFALIGAGFILWLASLDRLDLSYAYPLACASAALVALFGVLFLGETLTARDIFGILMIVLGTALLVPTR